MSLVAKIPSIAAIIAAIIGFYAVALPYFVLEEKYGFRKWFKPIKYLGVLMLIVPFLAGFITYHALAGVLLPATIYVDNGYNSSFTILIDGVERGSVEERGLALIEVERGDYTLEIMKDGEPFESLDISCQGNTDYVYNIGRKCTYYIVSHFYGVSPYTAHSREPEKVGDERFFTMPQVDFKLGEERPESVEAGSTTAEVRRTSLQREVKEEAGLAKR